MSTESALAALLKIGEDEKIDAKLRIHALKAYVQYGDVYAEAGAEPEPSADDDRVERLNHEREARSPTEGQDDAGAPA
jgi:hypothetical protein